MQLVNQTKDAETSEKFRGLFRVGGAAALIAVLFAIIQGVINGAGVAASIPVPSTVEEWFALLQSNRLFGLAALTFFEVPSFAFIVPVFLALYVALRQANRSFMTVATSVGIIGITIFLATNSALSLSLLSDQYAAATTDAQRLALLGAGQAVLTTYQVTGIDVGVFLVSIAILMVSAVMLQSNSFNKVTGYMGILDGIIALAYYPTSTVTSASIYVLIVSGVLLILWLILVGRRLFELGKIRP
jgi:hypothetical protein